MLDDVRFKILSRTYHPLSHLRVQRWATVNSFFSTRSQFISFHWRINTQTMMTEWWTCSPTPVVTWPTGESPTTPRSSPTHPLAHARPRCWCPAPPPPTTGPVSPPRPTSTRPSAPWSAPPAPPSFTPPGEWPLQSRSHSLFIQLIVIPQLNYPLMISRDTIYWQQERFLFCRHCACYDRPRRLGPAQRRYLGRTAPFLLCLRPYRSLAMTPSPTLSQTTWVRRRFLVLWKSRNHQS